MVDETKNKIIKASLELIINRGYTLTTTKDIANKAGVSEVTIFRKFKSKKEIVKAILEEEINNMPEFNMSILDKCSWSLKDDLKMFSELYFKYITPDYVKLIIGTRNPELFPLIKDYIATIPKSYKEILTKYFSIMYEKKLINNKNFEVLVTMYMSINFGFIFLITSFGSNFTTIETNEYINESIEIFARGLLP